MSEPWTPGPWVWSGEHDYYLHVTSQLFEELESKGWEQGSPGWRNVLDLEVESEGCVHDPHYIRVDKANARLIALAPEMAEFIASIEAQYVAEGEEYAPEAWRGVGLEARALLARARGET